MYLLKIRCLKSDEILEQLENCSISLFQNFRNTAKKTQNLPTGWRVPWNITVWLTIADIQYFNGILAVFQFPESCLLPSKAFFVQILCPQSFFHLLLQVLPFGKILAEEHLPGKYRFSRTYSSHKHENIAKQIYRTRHLEHFWQLNRYFKSFQRRRRTYFSLTTNYWKENSTFNKLFCAV